MTDITTLSLLDQCNAILAATVAAEEADATARIQPPLVRIWTGDWDLYGVLSSEYSAEFTWVDNESGTGMTEIPLDDDIARWIWKVKDRILNGQKRNVHITVDKDGARWGGRLHDHTVEKKSDGTFVMVLRWMHDYENLKYYNVWSNPFFPSFIQFPRTWLIAGPAIWALKLSLFVNVLREQTSLWAMPDDPMQGSSWSLFGGLDMSNWSVVVKPTGFIDDMNAGTMWAVPHSRWKYFHDMSKRTIDDAELSVICRRFLTGDEQPIPGQTLRNGALVIDIVDKSGYYLNTSNGGDPYTGLARTFAHLADDFIDSIEEIFTDPIVPDSYKVPGNRLTDKTTPYVIYFEGEETGIKSSKFTFTYATAIQVNCGGHSMPGVNELISAAINMAGDLIAAMIGIPPIGGMIDAVLAPFYTDTILAWNSVKSVERAIHSGWSRYYEYFQQGADRAYTFAALMALRTGFHATRSFVSYELYVRDGAPWFIGDCGKGHYFIGDRIGATVVGDFTKEIYIDRVKEIRLAWDRESFAEWVPTIGDRDKNKDRGQQSLGFVADLFEGLTDLGVLG